MVTKSFRCPWDLGGLSMDSNKDRVFEGGIDVGSSNSENSLEDEPETALAPPMLISEFPLGTALSLQAPLPHCKLPHIFPYKRISSPSTNTRYHIFPD